MWKRLDTALIWITYPSLASRLVLFSWRKMLSVSSDTLFPKQFFFLIMKLWSLAIHRGDRERTAHFDFVGNIIMRSHWSSCFSLHEQWPWSVGEDLRECMWESAPFQLCWGQDKASRYYNCQRNGKWRRGAGLGGQGRGEWKGDRKLSTPFNLTRRN